MDTQQETREMRWARQEEYEMFKDWIFRHLPAIQSDVQRYVRCYDREIGAMLRKIREAIPRHQNVSPSLEDLYGLIKLSDEEKHRLENIESVDGRNVRKMSNALLARHHLGYYPGCDEQIDNEFWGRHPDLCGLYYAMKYLGKCDPDPYAGTFLAGSQFAELEIIDPPENPIASEHIRPCVEALRKHYYARVQAIADGDS